MAHTTTIITGATSGIGFETARVLAGKGHALYLLVRNIVKGDELVRELKVETGNKELYAVKCDMADLHSVHTAVEKLKSHLIAINVLINNAGGMFSERKLSADGYEITFATNHLGHFALTQGLLPLLKKGQARIINTSSDAHKMGEANFDNINADYKYSAIRAYGTSKLYNIYFTKSLAEKYAANGITAFALHPGVVNTGFGAGATGLAGVLLALARPFMISPEKGAQTIIYLATQPNIHTLSGGYFNKSKAVKPAAIANDAAARERLWQVSEKLVSNKFE